MKCRLEILGVIATLGGVTLLPAIGQQTSSAPVAYVYVSYPNHIDGFAASSTGKLTPVPGSPFSETSVAKMSVTKKFLFGESAETGSIYTFAVDSHGSIKKVSTIQPRVYEPEGGCAVYPDIQVDLAGTTLYHQESPNCETNGAYLSFHIESNGNLQYLGNSGGYIDSATQGETAILTMLGSDKFAFDGYCAEDESDEPVIDIYKRDSNGMLMYDGQENHVPEAGSGPGYCTGMVAADSANHLAVAIQRLDSQDGDNGWMTGPFFLASYTVNSKGNLTTASTWENMPETTVTNNLQITALSISPSNQFLAVGGPQGFQIFRFNGSNPITPYSGALQPAVNVEKFGWDRSNHLYVLGSGKLFVYTVTSTSIQEASGSPYSIPSSSNVIVRDLQ